MEALADSPEHLPDTEGLDALASGMKDRKSLEKDIREQAACAHESWGQVLGTGRVARSERSGGSGSGLPRPRPQRVDELEHVVEELAGTVGGGQGARSASTGRRRAGPRRTPRGRPSPACRGREAPACGRSGSRRRARAVFPGRSRTSPTSATWRRSGRRRAAASSPAPHQGSRARRSRAFRPR
jgi:hypothetical protein